MLVVNGNANALHQWVNPLVLWYVMIQLGKYRRVLLRP
jgi:hypothetical protein